MNKEVTIHQLKTSAINMVILLLLSIFSTLFMELLWRSSFSSTFKWIIDSPSALFLNVFLFFSFHSLFFIFRRSWIWITISITFFYFLSVVNYFKLMFKNEVLVFQDFFLLADINGIFTKYIEFYHIFLFVFYVACIVWLCRYIGKRIKNIKYTGYLALFAVPFFFFLPYLGNKFSLIPNPEDVNKGFTENGFFYSFFETGESLKIDLPEHYSKENIKKITDKIQLSSSTSSKEPNVIFYQLESFFDPYTLPNILFEEDPIPYFHALQKEYPSGTVQVPVYGGSTVNSELEVLTGFNVKGFPPKTIPYVNYLKDTPIESLAHYFRKKNYTTYALHNHEMTFFSRHKVYKNMGFDYFIGKEAFSKKEYNSTGWMKDSLLVEMIDEAIKKTKEKDFIFSVGVQSHGYYPSTNIYDETINIKAPSLTLEEEISFQNYLHELKEVDDTIKLLIETANSWNEPTMIVFYGDHLPNLGDQGSFYDNLDYQNTYKYETPYVVWNNFGLKNETKHIPLYEFSTYLLDLINEPGTLMNQFHRTFNGKINKTQAQFLLQYDLIFGEQYAYLKDKFPYPMKELQYVLNQPKIHLVQPTGGGILVIGKNFIDGMNVTINDRQSTLQYLSPTTLFIPEKELKHDEEIHVYLEDTNGDIIAESKYLYK